MSGGDRRTSRDAVGEKGAHMSEVQQATPSSTGPSRTLKIGVAGIGQGAAGVLPVMEAMPEIDLAAGADVNPTTLERFKARYTEARVYDSVAKLCEDPDVEAVWVASPNRFHCEHTVMALEHGKHVIVEKPMAVSLPEAERMIEAAERNGVKLLAGHTNSFELPVRAMRRVIMSGELGPLRAVHIWSYTDWMLRARTADEQDPEQGGGIPYRQGSHQGDVVRLLGGGMLRSVRAMTGQWMPERPMPGYHSAYLEFEDGTPATMMHNGYGYFMTAEMFPWAMEHQRYTPEERVGIRRALRSGRRDEEEDKQAFRIGGSREAQLRRQDGPRSWTPADLGIVLVSCARGDIRNSRYGLYVYNDDGRRELLLPHLGEGGLTEHRAELEELYEAVVLGKPVYHSGQWGMATLEVVMAIIESARERREVRLTRQVPMPAEYDAELEIG